MPPAHAVGFDDAPFARDARGDVRIVGAVLARDRLDGVLGGRVRRDGINATRVLAHLVAASRFRAHLQVVFLQGIALAGFNVVDVPRLSARLALPVVVVARRAPDYAGIRNALLERVPNGVRKWRLIEMMPPMEPLCGVWAQWVGFDANAAEQTIGAFQRHGLIPEPLRVAHLIAGGAFGDHSRQRV